MDADANLTMATRFKTSAREEGKYKGRLVFCGDGADTLADTDVRDARRRCEALSQGGGFVSDF